MDHIPDYVVGYSVPWGVCVKNFTDLDKALKFAKVLERASETSYISIEEIMDDGTRILLHRAKEGA